MLGRVSAGIAEAIQISTPSSGTAAALFFDGRSSAALTPARWRYRPVIVYTVECVPVPEQPQEHGLEYVFGVGCVSCDSMGRPENAVMVRAENRSMPSVWSATAILSTVGPIAVVCMCKTPFAIEVTAKRMES